LLDNRGARDSLTFVAHEEFEQGEFLWAKFDGITAALDGVSDAIDLQIGDFEHGAAGAAAAAENGANASRKFGKGEGLRQGIVGTGIEQTDMIFREARPGDHQDG
jgi:hypothetical protein